MVGEVDPDALRRFYCFRDLSPAEAEAAAANLEALRLEPGTLLFREGDPGDHVYFLVSGRIEISASRGSGARHVFTTLLSGAILGEITLLLDEPRTATAAVPTDTHLWRLSREAFEGGFQRGERWAREFLLAAACVLAQRLSHVDQQLVALLAQGRKTPDQEVANLEALRNRLYAQWSHEELLFSPSSTAAREPDLRPR